jgi:hypothetical protein
MLRSIFKIILLHFIIVILILISEDIYARAGGGGGGGGSGGSGRGLGFIIALIVGVAYTIIVSVILYIKTSDSNLILNWAYKKDKIWDSKRMNALSKSIFLKMQQAWMNRDIDSVKKFISLDLYNDYKEQLELMKLNKEKNILESIYIINVKIISCEDFNDNTKDSFIAFITGVITDYTIREDTEEIIKNKKKEREDFTDTYHFIRQDGQWILNYIDNDVTLLDLIRVTNYKDTKDAVNIVPLVHSK